jgi:hypothetical protein
MKSFLDSVDVSTRRKRRKAMALAIKLLEKIRHAEEQNMAKIPLNLRPGPIYCEAGYCVDAIIDAIIGLLSAYQFADEL